MPKAKKMPAAALPPPKTPRNPNIEWAKNPDWTWSLISYFTDHPDFRMKFFSDATKDAKKEGRKKAVAKDGKAQQYAVLAEHVFKENEVHAAAYRENAARFSGSIETRIRRLRSDYQYYLKDLGNTGAGLDPEMITPGSAMANVVDTIRARWPWWDDLHAFWRELPHFNPIAVETSAPGIDHAANAAILFTQTTSFSGAENNSQDSDQDVVKDATSGDEGSDHDNEGSGLEDEPYTTLNLDDGNGSDVSRDITPPPAIRRPAGHSPSPPSPKLASAKAAAPATRKSKTPAGGRDLGLSKAKAQAPVSSKKDQAINKNAVDRFANAREDESARMAEKYKMNHELRMFKAETKRLRVQAEINNQQHSMRPPVNLDPSLSEELRMEELRMEEVRLQLRREELRIEEMRIQARGSSSAPLRSSSPPPFNSSSDGIAPSAYFFA